MAIGKQTKTTQGDASGKWKVKLDKFSVGFNGTMTVKGKNTLVIKDVLVGEVWLCSRQSNMAMSIAGLGIHKDRPQDIENADSKGMIRIFYDYSAAIAPQIIENGFLPMPKL